MKQALTFIFTLCISLLASAGSISSEQAQKFMQYSGMNDMIGQLPIMFEQQMTAQIQQKPDVAQRQAAQKALLQALNEVRGNQLALNYLTGEATTTAMPEIISFLESPLGKRLVDAEKRASTEQAQMAMAQYASELAQQPLPAERARLLDELLAALQVDRLMLQMMHSIFDSASQVSAEMQPEQAAAMKQAMAAQWQKMEPMLQAQMLQSATLSVYYSYRELSDQDLSAYTKFMRSRAGQAYIDLNLAIIQRYMDTLLTSMLRSLPRP